MSESIAYVTKNGTVYWENDKYQWHRLDGPAVEYADGTKGWYVNGTQHNLNGPAWESTIGYKEWRIDGVEYTESEWRKKVAQLNTDKEQ